MKAQCPNLLTAPNWVMSCMSLCRAGRCPIEAVLLLLLRTVRLHAPTQGPGKTLATRELCDATLWPTATRRAAHSSSSRTRWSMQQGKVQQLLHSCDCPRRCQQMQLTATTRSATGPVSFCKPAGCSSSVACGALPQAQQPLQTTCNCQVRDGPISFCTHNGPATASVCMHDDGLLAQVPGLVRQEVPLTLHAGNKLPTYKQ